MKINKRILIKPFVISFLMLFSIFCRGQEHLLSKLSAYKKLLDKNQIEKIHIQTNQPFYMNYDTLWFKAYIINANLNRPSVASHTLNLELIDPEGKLIREAKTKVTVGLTDGYLNLSDSLKSGNYILRAYTNTIQKFGEDFYYQKVIHIKGAQNPSKVEQRTGFDLSFFPEGGDMIQGLSSVVGFKALDLNGSGLKVKGVIKDDQGNLISSIASENLGMGKFEIIPKPGRKYSADITDEKGNSSKFKLPDAKPNGYVLKVISNPDSIVLKVSYTAELTNGSITIIGSQDGVTRYISIPKKTSSGLHLSIPKSQFYTGVVQFTLFNEDDLPVAERLIFCNHHNFLKINGELKSNYLKKEKVKILVDLKNVDDKNDIGSLSVSVYNESAYPYNDDNEQSIFSDLLLTSDLRGFIEKPNSYFAKANDATSDKNLDMLLLTQGWRRFSWKDKLSQSLPSVIENENIDQQITGKVELPSGKPYINGDLTLFQTGIKKNVFQTKTDSQGNFMFKDLNLLDTTNFVISTNTPTHKKNLKIEVFNLRKPLGKIFKANENRVYLVPVTSASSDHVKLDQLYLMSKGINLDQVNIKGLKQGPITESANLNGAGKADAVILAKDLVTTHDLSTYLLNNVNGLKTFEGKIYSRETPYPGQQIPPPPPPMLVILDGMPQEQGIFSISDIDPNDVSSIEVLKGTSAAIYGMSGMGGIIVISLKRGKNHSNDAIGKSSNGILPFSILGYQTAREFYSPKFQTQNQKDLRRALYWNPKVVTLEDRKIELGYFNSDYSGKFKVVIEGINADGQIGRAVYNYEVK